MEVMSLCKRVVRSATSVKQWQRVEVRVGVRLVWVWRHSRHFIRSECRGGCRNRRTRVGWNEENVGRWRRKSRKEWRWRCRFQVEVEDG